MSASDPTAWLAEEKIVAASPWRDFVKRFAANRSAMIGLVIIAALCIVALFAPLLAPYPFAAQDLMDSLDKPLTAGHLLGTDMFGRDILSRMIWGARVSLEVGVMVTVLGMAIGITVGCVAGYFGGRTDALLSNFINLVWAFPLILVALLFATVIGAGLNSVVIATALVIWAGFARIVRGEVLSLRQREFVIAAQALGRGHPWIIFRHILPNIIAPVLVIASFTMAVAVIIEASLSFLGLGAQPPTPSWGSMLNEGRAVMYRAWWLATFPGMAIAILVLGFNLLGDGLRDVLDPRMRNSANRPLLEVSDLGVSLHTAKGVLAAVDGISFTIAAGETLALVGESGCGKTMTALSVMRLVPNPPGRIERGRIRFGDDELLEKSPEQMRRLRGDRLSMVFQEPMTSLDPVFTIGRQMTETVLSHRDVSHHEAVAISVAMLRKVRISEPERRMAAYPHEMSGGMRQRVMIAMALLCRPDLLIADEPTTALDVTTQAQILELMRELRGEFGMAVLLITHALGVVAEMADRVAVMYAGRIVESAPVEELFRTPRHPYTIGLLNSIPDLVRPQDRLATIPGTVPNLLHPPPGCRFWPRCPLADDGCRAAQPPLAAVGESHLAACWKARA